MPSSVAEEARDLPLAELLQRARAAPGLARLDWRDPIVAHGAPAVDAIKPWLADTELSFFAMIVIRWVGEAGNAEIAVAALKEGLGAAPDRVKDPIRKAIEHLGGKVDLPSVGPHSTLLAPSYMHPETVFHVIIDQVSESGTPWGEIYLTACRWAYSGATITALGGLVPNTGQTVCGHCVRTLRDRI